MSNKSVNLQATRKIPYSARELALDKNLRRRMMKERRKAYREGLRVGMMTNFIFNQSQTNEHQEASDPTIEEVEDDDWTTVDEDDKDSSIKSADLRVKRLKVMREMPECFDKDMAGRLENLNLVFHI